MVSTGEALSCTHAMSYAIAIGSPLRSVEPNQRLQRGSHRRRRVRDGRVEVPDDGADLLCRTFRRRDRPLPRSCRRASPARELSGCCSSNPSRSLHRHADVEVVRARRENVLPGAGGLVRDDRIDRRVEEHAVQPRQHAHPASPPRRADTPRRTAAPHAPHQQTLPACT